MLLSYAFHQPLISTVKQLSTHIYMSQWANPMLWNAIWCSNKDVRGGCTDFTARLFETDFSSRKSSLQKRRLRAECRLFHLEGRNESLPLASLLLVVLFLIHFWFVIAQTYSSPAWLLPWSSISLLSLWVDTVVLHFIQNGFLTTKQPFEILLWGRMSFHCQGGTACQLSRSVYLWKEINRSCKKYPTLLTYPWL